MHTINCETKNRLPRFILWQAVLLALWFVPFVRAINFYSETKQVLDLYQSGDAGSDFHFSKVILFCYVSSFLCGTILNFLGTRKNSTALSFLFAISAASAFMVLVVKTEEVLVFIPPLSPLIAFATNIILLLIGTFLMIAEYFSGRRRAKHLATGQLNS